MTNAIANALFIFLIVVDSWTVMASLESDLCTDAARLERVQFGPDKFFNAYACIQTVLGRLDAAPLGNAFYALGNDR